MMEATKAILSIVDKDNDTLLCSQTELDLAVPAVQKYAAATIKKFKNAELKSAYLSDESTVKKILLNQELNFVEKATELANRWFEWIQRSDDIPSGDILCMECRSGEKDYFGLVKLNYKPYYTQVVDYESDQLAIQLIENRSILPTLTQRLEEAAFINLETFEVQLIEKKHSFEAKKVYYFTQSFLECQSTPSAKENISIVKKAVKEVADKYNEESFVSMSKVQQAVYESLESEGTINTERIAETVFEDNISAKQEYLERVERSNFTSEAPINVPKYEKKYNKQKLKLANGIEMMIPIDVYNDQNLIEFINNADGTISVIIKHVEEIINRF